MLFCFIIVYVSYILTDRYNPSVDWWKGDISLLHLITVCTRTPKCHMIGRPTVARRLADRRPTRCMLPDREMQSADHRATVGRMENIVVDEGNRWCMSLMWQLQSADQNRVCRPINIKKSGRPTVSFNVTQALEKIAERIKLRPNFASFLTLVTRPYPTEQFQSILQPEMSTHFKLFRLECKILKFQ